MLLEVLKLALTVSFDIVYALLWYCYNSRPDTQVLYSLNSSAIRKTYSVYIIRETKILYALEKMYSLLTYPLQSPRARQTATFVPLITIRSYWVECVCNIS